MPRMLHSGSDSIPALSRPVARVPYRPTGIERPSQATPGSGSQQGVAMRWGLPQVPAPPSQALPGAAPDAATHLLTNAPLSGMDVVWPSAMNFPASDAVQASLHELKHSARVLASVRILPADTQVDGRSAAETDCVALMRNAAHAADMAPLSAQQQPPQSASSSNLEAVRALALVLDQRTQQVHCSRSPAIVTLLDDVSVRHAVRAEAAHMLAGEAAGVAAAHILQQFSHQLSSSPAVLMNQPKHMLTPNSLQNLQYRVDGAATARRVHQAAAAQAHGPPTSQEHLKYSTAGAAVLCSMLGMSAFLWRSGAAVTDKSTVSQALADTLDKETKWGGM